MRGHLTGLIAAPYTAMNDDGTINLSAIERQAELLSAYGVTGAFICGTTGEGLSLTMDERMRVAERWVSVADDLVVIVHVGHTSIAECKKLARHAQSIGANAIAMVGPCYYKPERVSDLVSFCIEVASSAPELPFYYYHIPSFSGVQFKMLDLLKESDERFPTLAGIKFSCEDLLDFGQCLKWANGRYDMLFGKDEILLSALALGADGAVGSTYNFAAPLYHLIITAYRSGDMETAQVEQSRSMAIVQKLIEYGGIPAGKSVMKMIGIDCGPVRPPLRNLTKDEFNKLKEELENLGFFSYCSV